MTKRKISNIYLPLAKNLRKYRKQLNLSQQAVADKLVINRTTYTKYELSQAEPSIELLIKMAALYNVTVNDLLVATSNF